MKLYGYTGLARWMPWMRDDEIAHRKRCYLRAFGDVVSAQAASGLDVGSELAFVESELAVQRRCEALGLDVALGAAAELRFVAREVLAGRHEAALWNGAYEAAAHEMSLGAQLALSTQEPAWAREALDAGFHAWRDRGETGRALVLLEAENRALRSGLATESRSRAKDVVTLLCDAASVALRMVLAEHEDFPRAWRG